MSKTISVPVPPFLLGFVKAAYAAGLSDQEATLALRPVLLDGPLQSEEFRKGLKDGLIKSAEALPQKNLADLGHFEFPNLAPIRRL